MIIGYEYKNGVVAIVRDNSKTLYADILRIPSDVLMSVEVWEEEK